eukprot:10629576-Lingulodinium_polyedra.AAC.1
MHFHISGASSVPDLARRGRWRQQRNLEYYLPEVAGQQLLYSLAPPVVERIRFLDVFADPQLAAACAPASFSRP